MNSVVNHTIIVNQYFLISLLKNTTILLLIIRNLHLLPILV